VERFGDILDDRRYWNRSKIYCGKNWFLFGGSQEYFGEFFPCRQDFPKPTFEGYTREDRAAWYSTRGDRDKSVFLTQHYMKLAPRDWGLGDYPYKLWHRFVIAGSDTIIWAEPYAYNPIWFMGYDYDYNAARNSSLALELMPWQTHLGNLLTNMLQTAYRNLMNLTFYDTDNVNEKDIEKLQGSGWRQYASANFVRFSRMKDVRAGKADVSKLFESVNFPQGNIQEMLQMVNLLLSIMERVLGYSAQETGAAASHQQSVEEVKITGGASSSRVDFTGSFIDEGVDGWKRQLHDGAVAYKDPDISSEVSADIPDLEKHLQELGFEVTHKDEEKWQITGHKRSLRLEQFAASNEGEDLGKDKAAGQAIISAVGTIAGQPELFKQIGAKGVIKMLELAGQLLGAPPWFRIPMLPEGKAGDAPPENVTNSIKQAMDVMAKTLQEKQIGPASQHIDQVDQRVTAMEQMLKKLEGIYKIAEANQQKVEIQKQEAQAKMQLEAEKFQAEERRKDMAAQAEIKRKEELTKADVAVKTAEAHVNLKSEQQRAETEHQLEIARAHEKSRHDLAIAGTKVASDIVIAQAKAAAAPKKAKAE